MIFTSERTSAKVDLCLGYVGLMVVGPVWSVVRCNRNAPAFVSGAMENWGLVTYRETALLIDPAHSSSAAKQWVALVVGHELAHQWFGNLVTMVTTFVQPQ